MVTIKGLDSVTLETQVTEHDVLLSLLGETRKLSKLRLFMAPWRLPRPVWGSSHVVMCSNGTVL